MYAYVGNDPVNWTDPSGLCTSSYRPYGDTPGDVGVTGGPACPCADGATCLTGAAAYQFAQYMMSSSVLINITNSSPQTIHSNWDRLISPQNLQNAAYGICSGLIDADGDLMNAVPDRVSRMIGSTINSATGGFIGHVTDNAARGLARRIGWEIGSASRVVGGAVEGAKTGEKALGRLGVVGMLAGGAAGAYFAPEIDKFKNDIKNKTCGVK